MKIIRGTTPTHTFENDLDISIIKELYITYKQNNRTIVEKTKDNCTITNGIISVKLSQSDTLKLSAKYDCDIQIRVKTTEENAPVSEIVTVKVVDVLKDGVI